MLLPTVVLTTKTPFGKLAMFRLILLVLFSVWSITLLPNEL